MTTHATAYQIQYRRRPSDEWANFTSAGNLPGLEVAQMLMGKWQAASPLWDWRLVEVLTTTVHRPL